MQTFKQAVAENIIFVLSPDCKTEIRGFFTDERVDKDTIPTGWKTYEFRTNGCGNDNLCTLEKHVVVNFGGTYLTKKEIPMKNNYRNLSGKGGYTFIYPQKKTERKKRRRRKDFGILSHFSYQ